MIFLGILLFWLIPLVVMLWIAFNTYMEFRHDRVTVLLYHRLLSKDKAQRDEVSDDEIIWACYDTEFQKQMDYLHKAGYTTLDFDEYLQIRAGNKKLPDKRVIVTIDDGFLSSYTMAFPALKKNGQKATVFVALEPDEHTRGIAEGVDGFLNEEQMREMADNNISIQSHTITHCILTDLNDDQMQRELNEPIHRLSKITAKPVNHIAIPRSGYSRRVRKYVEKTGYKTACCNKKGTVNGFSDLLALPRIVIERDMSLDDFVRCLTPKYSLVIRLIGNVKRIPELLGGAHFADGMRKILYKGPLKELFQTSNLKKAIAVFALIYAITAIFFTWQTISNWLS